MVMEGGPLGRQAVCAMPLANAASQPTSDPLLPVCFPCRVQKPCGITTSISKIEL